MVKEALARPWAKNQVSKDEYTDINRTVSRMLYDRIGDLNSLQDPERRREWEGLARVEVEKAVRELEAGGEGKVDGDGDGKAYGHGDRDGGSEEVVEGD